MKKIIRRLIIAAIIFLPLYIIGDFFAGYWQLAFGKPLQHICTTYVGEFDIYLQDSRGFNFIYNGFVGFGYLMFFLCAGALNGIGYIFNWTYQETSVYICIYLYQFILIAESVIVLIKACMEKKCRVLAIINTSVIAILTIIVFAHYALPANEAFELCKNDLTKISECIGLNYMLLNVILYLGGFIVYSLLNRKFYKSLS